MEDERLKLARVCCMGQQDSRDDELANNIVLKWMEMWRRKIVIVRAIMAEGLRTAG